MKYYLKAWKNYAVFSGRATRTEYWMFTLFHVLVIVALVLFEIWLNPPGDPYGEGGNAASLTFMVMYYLYSIAAFLPSLGLAVRRLHDTGKSGWWYFISFVPLIGGLALLFFMIQESQREDNEFGEASTVDPEIFA